MRVLKYSKDKVEEGVIEDVVQRNLVWVDMIDPSDKDIRDLQNVVPIDIDDLRLITQRNVRSTAYDKEGYSVIVFRTPVIDKKIKTDSVAVIVTKKNNIITVRNKKEIPALDNIARYIKEKRMEIFNNPSVFVYHILKEITSDFFETSEDLVGDVEEAEEDIMRRPGSFNIRSVFKLKRALIYFHKALLANREAAMHIDKLKYIDNKQREDFRDLYHEILQLIDVNETQKDILAGVLEIYLSSQSNQLNIIMKRLTIMASFVLLPTLIAGIYGMNFQYIPEIHSSWGQINGYYIALGLMALSILGMYIFFKREKWL